MTSENKTREELLHELLELTARDERWHSLVQNAFDFVVILDRDGTYQYINRTVPGVLIKDLIGKATVFDHVSLEHISAVREAIEYVFTNGNATRFEANFPFLEKWFETSSSTIHFETFVGAIYENGDVVSVSMLFRDITDRKRLEEQLIQSQKLEAIGQLAGGIAHDFNNLLTAIMGFTELALMRQSPDSPVSDFLLQANIALERSRNLVRQLLTFSRHEITSPRILNLNDLILGIDELIRRVIPETIEIVTLPAEELWMTRIDSGQIEQVLINLAVNARDAMPQGGKIVISTSNVSLSEGHSTQVADIPPGEYVMLLISDSGTGMTNEVKAHAFEPYFTTKEVGKGTGLGLSTCYGIVSQSGGHILIDSEIDKGTTVTIYLPRVQGPSEGLRIRGGGGYLPTGTETVLLVEDEATVLQMTAYVLRQQGYTVLEAINGIEALRLAQEQAHRPVHLLLTDVVMPLMSGSQLAVEIKKTYPDIKLLFTSGYNDDTILRQITLEDDVMFMQKPFTLAILARRVREALDG